jgi:hypothetical protein
MGSLSDPGALAFQANADISPPEESGVHEERVLQRFGYEQKLVRHMGT